MRVIFIVFLFSSFISAQMTGIKTEKKHIVKIGDTLWDIATSQYNNPYDWKKIYKANSSAIKDPNLIIPGMEIYLPELYEYVKPEIKDTVINDVSVSSLTTTEQNMSASTMTFAATNSQGIINESAENKQSKPLMKIVPPGTLNEKMPKEQVFFSGSNKTLIAKPEYFNGKIKDVNIKDDLEKEGLLNHDDELILNIERTEVKMGDIFEIYAVLNEDSGEITAQNCGKCKVFFVGSKKTLCKIFSVNGFIEKGMLIKKK